MKKLAVLAALCAAFPAYADGDKLRARLTGYEEVPPASTPASGEFEARISRDEGSIEYELTYSGLQGTVSMAHIHFAQRGVYVLLGETALAPQGGEDALEALGQAVEHGGER